MEGSFPPPTSVVNRSSDPESQKSDSVGTEWTDEKHNEYLQSMEASFVDQLYNSLGMHGSLLQKEYSSDPRSSRQMHVSTRISSGQFKVLREGCWTKINIRKGESPLRHANEPRDLSVNPWVRHYRSGHRQTVASPSIQEKTVMGSTNSFRVFHPHSRHHDCGGSNTSNTEVTEEVTDQNFVDENPDEDVANQTGVNKTNTSVIARPRNDQVVPCRLTEDVGKISSSQKD